MFVKQVIDPDRYFPNWGTINGPTGKFIKTIGKLPNGDNIEVDCFVINGKTLRKNYRVWNNKMVETFYKFRDFVTGKFKKSNFAWETLDERFWEK